MGILDYIFMSKEQREKEAKEAEERHDSEVFYLQPLCDRFANKRETAPLPIAKVPYISILLV